MSQISLLLTNPKYEPDTCKRHTGPPATSGQCSDDEESPQQRPTKHHK